MRTTRWLVVAALAVAVLAVSTTRLPSDVDSWQPAALAGEVVLSVLGDPGAPGDGNPGDVLVGTRTHLYRMSAAGAVVDLGVSGPVHAMTRASGGVWLGSDEGLLHMATTGAARVEALAGVEVLAVSTHGSSLAVGAGNGLHLRARDGALEQLWPLGADPGGPVGAVLGTDEGVLFAHPEGLALVRSDGLLSVVVPHVSVVSLGVWDDHGRLWAGTRGSPLLLVSDDGGATWEERAEGLGFSAVNAVARDPGDGDRIVAGGSGLADGTGNAGTQWSDDDGQTWQVRQDRLSNTHVYSLLAQRDALRVHLSPPGPVQSSVPLPLDTARWYAGTNGSGVSTYRPGGPELTALRAAAPALRLLEPLTAGVLLLALLMPAYRHLKRGA